jgi:glycosyltransferase involved in cell wall biosynthesis
LAFVPTKPLTVAWISDFPIEWLPDPPEAVKALPRRHPATWEMVLLDEFEKDPSLRVHTISLRPRLNRSFSFERNGTVHHVLKAASWLRLGSAFWWDALLIRRVCRQIQPNLVHAWGNEKGAGLLAHRLGFPYLMTIQGLFGWYKERVLLPAYDRLMERFERISLARAPLVTTESNFAVQYLRERYPRLRVEKAEHAPNRLFAQVKRRPETAQPHFLSLGTLGYRKGTDLLFQALERLSAEMPFKVTVISNPNPDCVSGLRKQVSPKLWQRVQFKHHLLPEEVAKELQTPTMLLLPTRADTSPNAVKEAVVAGIPVVASEIGGIPDYVFPNKNGLLFEPNDLTGFVAAIRAACAHPLFREGKVDPQTLHETRDYLSPERMARSFRRAYDIPSGETMKRP